MSHGTDRRDPGKRLKKILAKAELTPVIRDRFRTLLLTLPDEDVLLVCDELAKEPDLAAALVRDLVLKYRFLKGEGAHVLPQIIKNQEAALVGVHENTV